MKEKILAYQFLQNRLESLSRQQALILNKISEINSTMKSLMEIEKGDVIFPIGSGVHVFGKISEKNKFLVEVGAGVVLEKDRDESLKILERRKSKFNEILNEVQKEINYSSKILEQLISKIERLSKDVRKI